MPKTVFRIPTWRCPDCDYSQDFDPGDPALMLKHFPGVNVGHCPACSLGQNKEKIRRDAILTRVTDPLKKTIVTVMDEKDIDNFSTPDELEDGSSIMRKLNKEEKDALRTKIRADVAYWRQHAEEEIA